MNAACPHPAVTRASLVESATPYQLTLMLFDGAIARIEVAREHTGDPVRDEDRRQALERALAIVRELQGALRDPDTDLLAKRLFMLYDYIGERLLESARTGQEAPLEESEMLLDSIRESWLDIDPGVVVA